MDSRPEEVATRMHPWEAVSERGQCRTWIRQNIRGLVDSISMTEKLDPEVVLRVLDALHCDAMGGKAAGDPCLLGLDDVGRRGSRAGGD